VITDGRAEVSLPERDDVRQAIDTAAFALRAIQSIEVITEHEVRD
jgi:hypothetical protein